MDTLRGQFEPADFSDDLNEFDLAEEAEEAGPPEPPPSPIGQDERRMQVRAYNHWAGLLGNKNYPAIEDLEPENLADFGPFSVLLEFTDGIEDPAIRFIGKELKKECGTAAHIERLSDVPALSLLSRITDHYMQILANQAPIGFEAEFVNQRGITILYRGILLPYSSDNDMIDFIYGVINWKEMADQHTTDELMLEIDQSLDGEEIAQPDLGEEEALGEDNILDLGSFGEADVDEEKIEDESTKEHMPRPSFGSLLTPEGFDDDDDDEDSMLPKGWSLSDPNNVDDDAEYADDSADVFDEDYDPDAEDDDTELGLTRIVEEEFERSGRQPIDLGELDIEGDAIDPESYGANAHDIAREEFGTEYAPVEPEEGDLEEGPIEAPASTEEGIEPANEIDEDLMGEDGDISEDASIVEDAAETEVEEAAPSVAQEPFANSPEPEAFGEQSEDSSLVSEVRDEAPTLLAEDPEITLGDSGDSDAGLHDCLADARELAKTAVSAEDRSRIALYAAVGRAYDVSLAAMDAPDDYDQLLEENDLVVQDRAPMTPIVKLVFGTDYDKTRITEYASALTHAHRLGIGRGKLGTYLNEFEGGLKGVVNAERRLRREEAGKPVVDKDEVRASLAKKLRAIEGSDLADIEVEGSEFALVMIRRTDDGDIVVLGEIDDDISLIERAGRKILG